MSIIGGRSLRIPKVSFTHSHIHKWKIDVKLERRVLNPHGKTVKKKLRVALV